MELLTNMLRKQKRLALAALCASGLTAAVTLWWNARLSTIITLVSGGLLPTREMILWTLITMLIMGTVNYVKGYLSGYACETMIHNLRMGYARYFTSLPIAKIETLNAGAQLSKLQNEIAGVSDYINANLFQLLDDAVRFLATFAWLLYISPALTLASNFPVFLIMLYTFWSTGQINTATERSQKTKGEMNQFSDTLLTLFPIIRLYDVTRLTLEGYASAVASWEAQTIRLERTKALLMSLSGVLSSIPLLLLFWVGGNMIMNGSITIGTLYICLNLSGNVSGALMNAPGYIAAFRQFSANAKLLSPYILLVTKGK